MIMAVKKRPEETLDSMMRRFKKEVLKSDIMKELKRREYYMSPSTKRKLKSEEAQRRLRKKLAKQPKPKAD